MPRSPSVAQAVVRPRVVLAGNVRLGPGKIDLLRAVDATRSISAAARSMDMSYKRAWLLVDGMNRDFGRPVVLTVTGGARGGGAELSELGQRIVARYAALERRLNVSASKELAALALLVRSRG